MNKDSLFQQAEKIEFPHKLKTAVVCRRFISCKKWQKSLILAVFPLPDQVKI
jgi:hypothetical protein